METHSGCFGMFLQCLQYQITRNQVFNKFKMVTSTLMILIQIEIILHVIVFQNLFRVYLIIQIIKSTTVSLHSLTRRNYQSRAYIRSSISKVNLVTSSLSLLNLKHQIVDQGRIPTKVVLQRPSSVVGNSHLHWCLQTEELSTALVNVGDCLYP